MVFDTKTAQKILLDNLSSKTLQPASVIISPKQIQRQTKQVETKTNRHYAKRKQHETPTKQNTPTPLKKLKTRRARDCAGVCEAPRGLCEFRCRGMMHHDGRYW